VDNVCFLRITAPAIPPHHPLCHYYLPPPTLRAHVHPAMHADPPVTVPCGQTRAFAALPPDDNKRHHVVYLWVHHYLHSGPPPRPPPHLLTLHTLSSCRFCHSLSRYHRYHYTLPHTTFRISNVSRYACGMNVGLRAGTLRFGTGDGARGHPNHSLPIQTLPSMVVGRAMVTTERFAVCRLPLPRCGAVPFRLHYGCR